MFELQQLAQQLHWDWLGSNLSVESISTDTRTLQSDALFVALVGDRFDGHDYLDSAFKNGAEAAIVHRNTRVDSWPNKSFIFVDDTKHALQQIAKWWRAQLNLSVVAIVGSNGKTTTKEMICSIFKEHFGERFVHATHGNFNNDIGLPLTLLNIRQHHKVSIVEIGMNHSGETSQLAKIAAPNTILINNAQREHQLYLKSVEQVAWEHGDIIKVLPNDGTAILNSEDNFCEYWRSLANHCKVKTFGLNPTCFVNGQLRNDKEEVFINAEINGQQTLYTSVKIPGLHNGMNALAAIAVASSLGVSPEKIHLGLQKFRAVSGRLKVLESIKKGVLIDDSYNANPDSYLAAVDVLKCFEGKTVLVMGDMDEAGEAVQNENVHAEIGMYAKKCGIDSLITIGSNSLQASKAYGPSSQHFESTELLIQYIKDVDSPQAVFLIKGSRFMRMELIVKALTES